MTVLWRRRDKKKKRWMGGNKGKVKIHWSVLENGWMEKKENAYFVSVCVVNHHAEWSSANTEYLCEKI